MVDPKSSIEALVEEQTWRALWSQAAYQVVSALPSAYERVAVGSGWGLRSISQPGVALVVHPSGEGRDAGELSLTVRSSGTHMIPRCGRSYIQYLDAVADIVETTAKVILDS